VSISTNQVIIKQGYWVVSISTNQVIIKQSCDVLVCAIIIENITIVHVIMKIASYAQWKYVLHKTDKIRLQHRYTFLQKTIIFSIILWTASSEMN